MLSWVRFCEIRPEFQDLQERQLEKRMSCSCLGNLSGVRNLLGSMLECFCVYGPTALGAFGIQKRCDLSTFDSVNY
jgi:hypothetical protein